MIQRLYHQPKMANDIFSGKPEEIVALRRALQWTTADLANYLGLKVYDHSNYTSAVQNWEQGKSKPAPVYLVRMLPLVEICRKEYYQGLDWVRKRRKRGQMLNKVIFNLKNINRDDSETD